MLPFMIEVAGDIEHIDLAMFEKESAVRGEKAGGIIDPTAIALHQTRGHMNVVFFGCRRQDITMGSGDASGLIACARMGPPNAAELHQLVH